MSAENSEFQHKHIEMVDKMISNKGYVGNKSFCQWSGVNCPTDIYRKCKERPLGEGFIKAEAESDDKGSIKLSDSLDKLDEHCDLEKFLNTDFGFNQEVLHPSGEYIELADIGLDPFSDAVLFAGVGKMTDNWEARTNLAQAIYPDKEAMRASGLANDLLERIDDDTLTTEDLADLKRYEVDYIYLRRYEKSEIIHTQDNFDRNEQENEKVLRLISDKTNISVSRINRATEFWLDSLENK